MGRELQDFFESRHILVLGAGYVGSALIDALLPTGARLSAVTRNPQKARELQERGVRVVLADLASADWHASLEGGADHVLYCAAPGGGGEDAYRRTYLHGIRSMLDWAGTRPVSEITYTSSTAVYPQSGGVLVDETFRCEASTGLSALLVEAERALLESTLSSRKTVLRLSGIYGPARHYFLDQVRCGEVLSGRPEQCMNLIHRDDIVGAVLCLWRSKGSKLRCFNLVDDQPSPREEVAHWSASRLGLPIPPFSGEVAPGRRGSADRRISNALFKREFSWQPRYPSFREGFGALLQDGK